MSAVSFPVRRAARARAAARFVVVLLSLVVVRSLGAQPASALPPAVGTTISGTVLAWPDSTPLAGALVSVDALQLTAMAGRDGRFRITGLPAGMHTLRVRQVGFRPQTLTVRVLALAELPSTESPGYTVSLPRLPAILDAVVVRAPVGVCRGGGWRTVQADRRIAPVMEQLRANAERWEELSKQWPVEYTVARSRHFRVETGALFAQQADTVRRRSDVRRPYTPGHVLERSFQSGRATMEREMHVPSFADVAGEDFQQSHCFRYAGLERIDGMLLHRVDFVPGADVRTADVEGSLYIDAYTFLLRRSIFRLTSLPPRMRVRHVEVITTYRELFPAVLVPDALTTTQLVRGIKVGGARVIDYLQRDQLVAHRWVKEKPAEDAMAER